MKRVLFSIILGVSVFFASSISSSAQTFQSPAGGDFAAFGSLGYQTNYERFGLSVQGRYNLARNIRLAPDVMFFFPKNKVTGLDVNLNAHYVFYFPQDRFSVYPLAGIGMQNNFWGKQKVEVNGHQEETDSFSRTKFAFNLGGGITYQVSPNGYLNAELKFMFADDDAAVLMLGYGVRF